MNDEIFESIGVCEDKTNEDVEEEGKKGMIVVL
jgi:hypothetical protein